MKEEAEPREMLPEYDFSGASRADYSRRFGERRAELLRSAAASDMQTWLAHSLSSFQKFESYLVAYWSLVLHEDPVAAGKRVNMLLELLDKESFKALSRDLNRHTSVNDRFYEELKELIRDRNWLVHKSSLSYSSSRLESIANRSARLTEQVSSLLLERCLKEGMKEPEVKEKVAEVVAQWAADRNAA